MIERSRSAQKKNNSEIFARTQFLRISLSSRRRRTILFTVKYEKCLYLRQQLLHESCEVSNISSVSCTLIISTEITYSFMIDLIIRIRYSICNNYDD